MVVVIAFVERGFGRKYPIAEECVIGRQPDCDIQLFDTQISKRHARIFRQAERYRIEDLKSLNGVFVNGGRIREAVDLSPNDMLTIGSQSFVFDPNLDVLPLEGNQRVVLLLKDEPTSPAAALATLPAEEGGLASLGDDFVMELLSLLARGDETSLERILGKLGERIAFDAAAVLLAKDGEVEEPICIAGRARTVAISRTIANLVISERKGIRLPDAVADPAFRRGKSVVSGKLRSVLAVPLWLREGVVGAVFLTKDCPDFYSDADLRLLLQTAPFLALAAAQTVRVAEFQKQLAHQTERQEMPEKICGESAAMVNLRKVIRQVAPAPSPVLITGETGTGKELVAQWLHALGPAPARPFVVVNCGAVPENLIESEFFGHEKGAFSGADRRKIGKLELASGGTLFLDEIGELPLMAQVKLLRVLEQRSFYRVGGIKPIHAKFRLVAATHRDLREMSRAGQFREDLFYRVHVIQIEVPALRERVGDIEPLIKYFIETFRRELGKDVRGLDDAALKKLKSYSWPGNIRELKNVIERIVVLSEQPIVSDAELPLDLVGTSLVSDPGGLDLSGRVQLLEREVITRAMRKARGKKAAAARLLGISRPTLDKKLSEHAIDLFQE